MNYVLGTAEEQREMLESIGKKRMDDLFACIPDSLRHKEDLPLPEGMCEPQVIEAFEDMANNNKVYKTCFRGAGAYRHFIPSVVSRLAGRAEFVTAYTPYQAEMSQGVLQAIFEYQTMICELTGMEASNAGVYDGAQAAAEALAMFRERKRTKSVVCGAVKPMTLQTIKTYCETAGAELAVVPEKNGRTDLDALEKALDDTVSAVYVEQPNYYGLTEEIEKIADLTRNAGAKLVTGCYPISLALLKSPGEYGADAAVGEAQPLGNPLSFGGPYLGFMAVKMKDVRRLPGRIVGQTVDNEGRTAYVLTLQAREQHIRREKAGSSICSNQALCALSATIYCAAMGKEGLREVALRSMEKAHYAAKEISRIKGYELIYDGFFFNEFVTACPVEPGALMKKLAENDILGGLPFERDGQTRILWCCTEVNTREEIDKLVELLKGGVPV